MKNLSSRRRSFASLRLAQDDSRYFEGELKSNIVASSLDLHKKTLGIVPEVAARKQAEVIIPVIVKALKKAKITLCDLSAVAVTVGPGLIGSLLIGVETAKSFAYLLGIPIIPDIHIEGHIMANFLARKSKAAFPAIVLTVSGGHTSLVLMKSFGEYKLLGETIDDAAGEAFDKVAKLLGLGFPGGPAISAAAAKLEIRNPKHETSPKSQNSNERNTFRKFGNSDLDIVSKFDIRNSDFHLPRPMVDSGDFNFSFSGIKTSVLYLIRDRFKNKLKKGDKAIIAKEFQEAMVETLISKTIAAAGKYRARSIFLSGGVAANRTLRIEMRKAIKSKLPKTIFSVPDFEFCTDNAAMIGMAGALKYLKKQVKDWYDIGVQLNPKI